MVVDINKLGNILKYSTGKTHLFKGGFYPVENPKVGLQAEILERNKKKIIAGKSSDQNLDSHTRF